jgi:hypothetical protein
MISRGVPNLVSMYWEPKSLMIEPKSNAILGPPVCVWIGNIAGVVPGKMLWCGVLIIPEVCPGSVAVGWMGGDGRRPGTLPLVPIGISLRSIGGPMETLGLVASCCRLSHAL